MKVGDQDRRCVKPRVSAVTAGVGAIFFCSSSAALGAEGCSNGACSTVAELACGDGVRLIARPEALPLAFGTRLTADSRADWQDLWRYLALPGQAPAIDFNEEYVVAWIERRVCSARNPTFQLCRDGTVQLRLPNPTPTEINSLCFGPVETPAPRVAWIVAVSRGRIAEAMTAAAPERDLRTTPTSCEPEISRDSLSRRARAAQAAMHERGWLKGLDWDASVGVIGGASATHGGVVGAELRAGLRDNIHLGGGQGFLGNLVGLNLRARWLMGPNAAHPHAFMVGLWPWMMMTNDWIFHRNFSRQPTFMTLVVPEGGIVFNRGVGGYLSWSFPIMLRPRTYFYRTSPYIVGEHWTYELAPGVLWFFEPSGQRFTFTLSASAGLW